MDKEGLRVFSANLRPVKGKRKPSREGLHFVDLTKVSIRLQWSSRSKIQGILH